MLNEERDIRTHEGHQARRTGFTLIELLVVIAIISPLVYRSAMVRANDRVQSGPWVPDSWNCGRNRSGFLADSIVQIVSSKQMQPIICK